MAQFDLSAEINLALEEYSKDVKKILEEEKKKVATETVKYLSERAPRSKSRRSGRYAESFKATKRGSAYVVHSPKEYRLTHLLERGHATVDGGRTKAQPHFEPAQQYAQKEFTERMEKRLK